ncbi:hypothetical protein LCGC14_2216110 [marine sediment metagenome]|uniref:HTH luxR-type domain-containing protein n=1 Tax=marine sediment metagenome TaxID=412755 RepID=A0A0F9DCB3_9ZZZZ
MPESVFPELSERQAEVAELAAMGNTNAQIADELGLEPNTVGTHIKRALKKLGLNRKGELTRMMMERTKGS